MNLKIEKMLKSDFELIKNNLKSDFDDFWNENILEEELKNENHIYIVAKDVKNKEFAENKENFKENKIIDEEIVGFCGISVVLDEAEIMNIVVKKSKRGIGIGKALLEKIINISRGNKIKVLKLEVNSSNFVAINLYKSFGFKEVGKRLKYYDSQYDAILMNLEIKK